MRFVRRAEYDARRSVVVGARAGDVFEPVFVGFEETFRYFGTLFVEVVRLAGIGFHIVEFERYVVGHAFVGKASRVDQLPSLFAHGYVV